MNTEQLLENMIEVLKSKKAKDIDIINIKEVSILADYFVICTGTSTTHIKTLADELEFKFDKDNDASLRHKEGYSSARWILLDYGDIVVHIFHEEDRNFYNLERLWSDGILTIAEE